MAPKELLALRLLIDHSRGLYGSEFVTISKGALGRATVYTILSRLVDKGFIREVEDEPTSMLALARTRHVITAAGARAFHAAIGALGLQIDPQAFQGAST